MDPGLNMPGGVYAREKGRNGAGSEGRGLVACGAVALHVYAMMGDKAVGMEPFVYVEVW